MEVLLFAALIPAVALMYYIWKKDKGDKEPASAIMKVAGAGALTVISALILEVLGEHLLTGVLGWDPESLKYGFVYYVFVVALAEELGKYVAVSLRTWKSPNFNYTYDAVVYAVASSLGFAAVENVAYVFSYGFATAVVRAVTSIPGHAVFGVYMGYFYGMARQAKGQERHGKKLRYLICGLIVPVILHGFYDFFLFEYGPDFFFGLWLAYVIILFIFAFITVNKLAAMDTPILGTGLGFHEDMPSAAAQAGFADAAQPAYGQPVQPFPEQAPPRYGYGQPVQAPPPQTPPMPYAPVRPANVPPAGGGVTPLSPFPGFKRAQQPVQYNTPPQYGAPRYPQYNAPPQYGTPRYPQYNAPPQYGTPQYPQYNVQNNAPFPSAPTYPQTTDHE